MLHQGSVIRGLLRLCPFPRPLIFVLSVKSSIIQTSSSDSLWGTEKQLVTSIECLSMVPERKTALSYQLSQ